MIPKALREQIGLFGAGPVDIEVDGTSIRIEPLAEAEIVERDGLWVIPAAGTPITFEMVDELRRGTQR